MQKITIFRNVKATDKPYYITPDVAHERIHTGKSKDLVEKIRTSTDSKERTELKKGLPSICFSGEFARREDAALIKHSGLIAIDFDHVNERLPELRKRLEKDTHTFMLFLSPSGDGLKLVVKIPDSIETHAMSAAALTDYYGDEKLDEFRDVSRICFESYDPDIYYNPFSEVFKTLKEEKVIKRTIHTVETVTDFDIILTNIEKWLDSKGEYYTDGNKHKYLVKLFAACNRFGIPLMVARQLVTFKYVGMASSVDPKDIHAIADKIYKNYSNSARTSHFDRTGKPIETVTKKVLEYEAIDVSIPLTDVIYLDNVRDSMLQSFKSGRSRGESTYFRVIDNHFRFKRGELTLMHGIMNQGKSTMVMQLCLLQAAFAGKKFAFFSPEQDPPDDFYDDLIHMFIGLPTQKHYAGQMSEREYLRGMDFVQKHFFYIYPENESPTPEYINARFMEVIKKHNVDGCIIDPYNQLDNDIRKTGGREDLYLSAFLSTQKRFAQQHQIYMIIVAHPRGSLSKNNNGDYEKPNVYDLAGGAMWSNKCDNVICTYRPYYTSDKKSKVVQFSSQKIKKQKLCGTPGDVDMLFDIATMRYYELENKERQPNPLEENKRPEPKNFYEKEDKFEFNDEPVPFD